MKKRATDVQIPTAMAPPENGLCNRCGRKSEICRVYYPRRGEENARNLCSDCRKDCGQGSRWWYAGGGDIASVDPAKRTG